MHDCKDPFVFCFVALFTALQHSFCRDEDEEDDCEGMNYKSTIVAKMKKEQNY